MEQHLTDERMNLKTDEQIVHKFISSSVHKFFHRKGFSLTEVIITISLFILLAGGGVGAYFNYYMVSLYNADVDNAMTLIKNTRFKALKNATIKDYGVHIDTATNTLTGFRSAYAPGDPENVSVQLKQLSVTDLSLNPMPGSSNEILFKKQTGKTENTGSFTIGKDAYTYVFNINAQGVVN